MGHETRTAAHEHVQCLNAWIRVSSAGLGQDGDGLRKTAHRPGPHVNNGQNSSNIDSSKGTLYRVNRSKWSGNGKDWILLHLVAGSEKAGEKRLRSTLTVDGRPPGLALFEQDVLEQGTCGLESGISLPRTRLQLQNLMLRVESTRSWPPYPSPQRSEGISVGDFPSHPSAGPLYWLGDEMITHSRDLRSKAGFTVFECSHATPRQKAT